MCVDWLNNFSLLKNTPQKINRRKNIWQFFFETTLQNIQGWTPFSPFFEINIVLDSYNRFCLAVILISFYFQYFYCLVLCFSNWVFFEFLRCFIFGHTKTPPCEFRFALVPHHFIDINPGGTGHPLKTTSIEWRCTGLFSHHFLYRMVGHECTLGNCFFFKYTPIEY